MKFKIKNIIENEIFIWIALLIFVVIQWSILVLIGYCIGVNSTNKKLPTEELQTEENVMYEPIQNEESSEILFTREDEVYLELKSLEKIEDKREYLIRYKEIFNEYSDVFPKPVEVYDIYSEDNIYLMQRVIETETYGCDFESKTHVASVILNRIEGDNNFGNTVEEVIKPGQFCYHRKQITEDTVLALEYAFMIEDTSQGSLYFHSGNKTNTFSGAQYVFTDSVGHHFYR